MKTFVDTPRMTARNLFGQHLKPCSPTTTTFATTMPSSGTVH
ncbi:MAG: hypothetical protein PF795_04165 [Kiritimatiellae bacterium]|nr:hypothetical protein [Kiritimatiellia bacterium]